MCQNCSAHRPGRHVFCTAREIQSYYVVISGQMLLSRVPAALSSKGYGLKVMPRQATETITASRLSTLPYEGTLLFLEQFFRLYCDVVTPFIESKRPIVYSFNAEYRFCS